MAEAGFGILVISHMFPTAENSITGIFVGEQVEELSRHHRMTVLSPQPYWVGRAALKPWSLYRLLKDFRRRQRAPRPVYRFGARIFYPFFLAPAHPVFWMYGMFWLLACFRLAWKHRREFEVIHAHNAYPDGWAAVVLGKILKKRVIITEHTGPFNNLTKNPLVRLQTLFALRRAHAVISVSRFLKSEICSYRIPEAHVRVIPNGFDPRLFRPAPAVTCTEWQILFVGFLVPVKGIENLLRAGARLIHEYRASVRINIVGNGPQGPELRALARELGIADRVRWFPQATRREVARHMRERCHVFVLPSSYETFGVVAVEALAVGRPVVATRCGGPEDIVTDDVGRLAPPNDPEALADTLYSAIRELTRRDFRIFRSHAETRFSYPLIAQRISQLYREVVGT